MTNLDVATSNKQETENKVGGRTREWLWNYMLHIDC